MAQVINPQESWRYPLAALGAYREWLQDVYIEGGKFSAYLKGKVSKGELPVCSSARDLGIGTADDLTSDAMSHARLQNPP